MWTYNSDQTALCLFCELEYALIRFFFITSSFFTCKIVVLQKVRHQCNKVLVEDDLGHTTIHHLISPQHIYLRCADVPFRKIRRFDP